MTNDEYLRSLANDSPDKLAEYLRAEHVDDQQFEVKLTLRGDGAVKFAGLLQQLLKEVRWTRNTSA